MSQFTINGVTFEDDKDSLQHGLGVGGGRGRPKGSRNGYINPNAAYMKNYQVVGEVADYSDPLNTGKRPANPPRERTWAPSPQSPGPTRRITTKEAQKRLVDSFRKQGEYRASQKPADSVQSGKTLMEKVLKEQTLPEQTIQEQYLTETKPAETQTEKPSQERTQEILNWLQNDPDADKKIREYFANNPKYQSGIDNYQPPQLNLKMPPDATTQAIIDAGDFLRDNVLNPVEQWAGERGRDLERWWNGYDVAPTGSPKDRERRQAGETDHVPGARERIEESLSGSGDTAKDWWNGLLDWGEAAWNDLSGAATSAIDTGKGWAKSGLDWVNKNILNPAGTWGSRALSDIGGWLGDRASDLDRWWNGYETTPVASETRTQGDLKGNAQMQSRHVNGFRENAGSWINNAVDDTGRWINDRGQDLNRFWNGYESTPVPSDTRIQGDLKGNAQMQSRHVNGFRENATELGNTFVRQVVDAAGNVRDAVVNGYGEVIGFLERAPESLGEAAAAAGQAIQNIPTQVGNRVQDIRVNMSSAANAARDAGLDQGVINTLLDATQNGTGQLSEEGITNLLNEYAAGFTSEAEIRRIADEVRNGK